MSGDAEVEGHRLKGTGRVRLSSPVQEPMTCAACGLIVVREGDKDDGAEPTFYVEGPFWQTKPVPKCPKAVS